MFLVDVIHVRVGFIIRDDGVSELSIVVKPRWMLLLIDVRLYVGWIVIFGFRAIVIVLI